MRVRLAFQQAVDERFLVTVEFVPHNAPNGQGTFSIATFEDENAFIQQVVLAGLSHDDTVSIISAVMLTLARRGHPEHWLEFTLTGQQMRDLCLFQAPEPPASLAREQLTPLHDVIMQTPTPIAIVSGPEHRFTFCNPAYADLMQRPDLTRVLGYTVREVFPELQGQPFLKFLDDVFRTGKEYVGREVAGTLRNSINGNLEKHFFDFVYYPVRDRSGVVTGIVAQASDVTVNVLIRQVAESREEQLYTQWAELEAIYRHSPLAMCLLHARDFRILRCNDLTAEQFNLTSEELIGKRMTDLLPDVPELTALYQRVRCGEVIRNYEFSFDRPSTSGLSGTWLLTLSPLFGENGDVDRIEFIATEATLAPSTYTSN